MKASKWVLDVVVVTVVLASVVTYLTGIGEVPEWLLIATLSLGLGWVLPGPLTKR